MPTPNSAEALTKLASELQAQANESLTAQTVLDNALETIHDAEMASLTVKARGRTFRTMGSTHRTAEIADEGQYRFGEGPCVESAQGAEWFRSGDLASDSRWPQWTPVALANGIRSLLSVSLDSNGEPFGALNLYSTRTGAFADRSDVDDAIVFAVHAANALRASQMITGLETALGSRHNIGMAQGILIERFGLSVDQSFALLQRLSQQSNRKLRELAAEIVETKALPTLDPASRDTEMS